MSNEESRPGGVVWCLARMFDTREELTLARDSIRSDPEYALGHLQEARSVLDRMVKILERDKEKGGGLWRSNSSE